MADNKVNMSLDDIIKSERKSQKVKNSNGKKQGARLRRNVVRNRRGKRNSVKLNAATVKAVNRLVKKAISQRSTQQLIQRAVNRRAVATRRLLGARSAGFRARRSFAAQPVVDRLRGVNRRSRVIRSVATRRVQQQEPIILSSNVKSIRGRGTARLGQLVSDDVPVYVKQRLVPVIDDAVIDEVPRMQFRRRRQAAQPRRFNRPVVTYVPARSSRNIIKRNRFVREVEPVIGRVRPRKCVYVNPNVAQMREALGIGKRVQRVVERFEPSSSFLQRVPETRRKGRGFRNMY